MADSPVFVLGAQRSGTTLVGEMIAAQPGVSLAVNGKLAYYLSIWFGREACLGDHEHLRLDEIAYALGRVPARNSADLGLTSLPERLLELGKLRRGSEESIEKFAGRLWSLSYHALNPAAVIWGEKYNELVLNLSWLSLAFPTARIVYVHRDKIDVAESMVRHFAGRSWAPMSLSEALMKHQRWTDCWLDGREFFAPEQRCEIAFEELIANPEAVIRACCEKLRMPFVASRLEKFEIDPMRVGRGLRYFRETQPHVLENIPSNR